jgi:hypothetical protein
MGTLQLDLQLQFDRTGARFLRGLADLMDEAAGLPPSVSALDQVTTDSSVTEGSAPEWDLDKVRKDATGGESQVWRPMLRYLADRPDEWVYWKKLCAAVERTPAQMAGALGAAERRCGGKPPYEKRHDGTDYQFRMPKEVAAVITEVPL